ncbi:MAG TPA: S41 family peptidase [Kamptonema sp.]|nr:S41 family peptidase [Kamptonema sp.]
MYKRVFGIAVLVILQLVAVLGCGSDPAWALSEEQQFLNEAWRIVNRSYVDDTFNHKNWRTVREEAIKQPLANREATYGEIQKMLAVLDDPFTRLLKPEQYRSLQVNTSGELTGVGLQIGVDSQTGVLTVVAPLDGSPAAKAGLLPRDRILKIDGTNTTELTLDEAATRMRGVAGTPVMLTVAHEGSNTTEEIQVVRDRIALNPVYAELRSAQDTLPVGYIRLAQFSANAVSELTKALQRLEKQGANAYILDLRNNPGGLLQSGIEAARLWLDAGTIVYTVNRQGILGSFEAFGEPLTRDPLVVLVNQGTASASEILAGALHDNGRAKLVGEKTFGKGLIQSLFDLSDGSGLAVTVAKYETPNHTDINKLGIMPDQIVTIDPTRDRIGTQDDPQYQAALAILTAQTEMAVGSN